MNLHRLSKVKPAQLDSVQASKQEPGGKNRRAMDVLLQAQAYYQAMNKFRNDRERNKRYNYGDQWGDKICVDGRTITEEQYILEQGNVPLKNNLIHRLVRNVIGVFRQQSTEPTCMARDREEQQQAETMSTVLQYNMQLNRMNEIYARTMEEFLISGLIVHKKWYGWRNDKMDCWTDYVQPNNFFIDNHMRDFRAWDCSLIGEIHDVSFEQVVQQFARSPKDYFRLAEIYRTARDSGRFYTAWEHFGYSREHCNIDFLVPHNVTLCRVIEVWRKETKPRFRCHDYNNGDIFKVDEQDYQTLVAQENQSRLQRAQEVGMPLEEVPLIEAEWFMDSYWYYYFLSPFGDILAEGETPYKHRSHPYVVKAYPFIDGEIHSFVSDIIDQQRYTNRLITLYDWIMRASAKGVLLIPEDAIPKHMSPEDFADTWTKFNGVVVYKAKPGVPAPQQVSSNSTHIGIQELLQLQINFFEDISGVNGALQGKQGYSGMSAALYSQQTQNATTSLLDLLDSFQEFVKDAAYKDVKNMQQFYDQKRLYNIVGRNGMSVEYDPEKIQDVEFDLNVVPSQATPVYRAMANDFLMQIWQSGQISLEQLLQNGDFPFSDQLLQTIQAQKEAMQQQATQQATDSAKAQEAPFSPELQSQLEQASQGANPEAVSQLQQALRTQQ